MKNPFVLYLSLVFICEQLRIPRRLSTFYKAWKRARIPSQTSFHQLKRFPSSTPPPTTTPLPFPSSTKMQFTQYSFDTTLLVFTPLPQTHTHKHTHIFHELPFCRPRCFLQVPNLLTFLRNCFHSNRTCVHRRIDIGVKGESAMFFLIPLLAPPCQ